MSENGQWLLDGMSEPSVIGVLPPCLVCGALGACGTDGEGAGWNHYHRLDFATGQALADAAKDTARAATLAQETGPDPSGQCWGETVDLAGFEEALFGPGPAPAQTVQGEMTDGETGEGGTSGHVRGQVPFDGVTFDAPTPTHLPPWNGYHSIICVADCDGRPDGVACDCLCHPYGAAPPRGVVS